MMRSRRGQTAAPVPMREADFPRTISVIDSHTEGEPTRVVVSGWDPPEGRTMAARREALRTRSDHLRRAVVCEPRGHDAVVGALLTPPVEDGSLAGVIFFNDVGYLGMCGHGLIGVVRTLEFQGKLAPGKVRIDTPAGTVGAELHEDGSVAVENVPAFCHAQDVEIEAPWLGRISGDIAYGGNWFFLTELPREAIHPGNIENLLRATRRIREALRARGITGTARAEIDHIELSGPPSRSDADSRNFVLCPGAEYDRSPCGTGTSAKMAVLHARGELKAGQLWRQESVTGSLFTGWLTESAGRLIPHIQGRAFITGEATLHFDPRDEFRGGIPPA
jgi:4-hydroxyproline epimerase